MTTCWGKKKFIVCEMNNDEFFGTNTLDKTYRIEKQM